MLLFLFSLCYYILLQRLANRQRIYTPQPVHSGIGHKCTSCSNVFSRTDQKHGCSGFSFQLIKKSSGTFTGKEAIEFQTFQRNRSKFCNPVQRLVHTQLGNANLAKSKRRTKCSESPLPKKKRCHGLPPSAEPSRNIIPLMDP